MQKPSIDFHDLVQLVLLEVHAAWRFRWHALVVAWGVVVVGALLVFALPNKYQSTAQVYADTNMLESPLLRGIAVQPNVNARLQVITSTLLARPNLDTVANKTGLALRASTPADRDKLLLGLAAAVEIKSGGAENLYNLSYDDINPRMSQKVVQAFIQILMNDTLGVDASSNEAAQTFLRQQVNEYNDRLNASAQKVAEFKKSNPALLASQGGTGLASRLQDAEARLQALQGEYSGARDGHGSARGSAAADPRVREVDQQIAAYQQKLNALLLTYTSEYPDVVAAKRNIAQLQARRTAIMAGKVPSVGTAAPVSPVVAGSGSVKRALASEITTQKAQVVGIKAQLDKVADAQAALQEMSRDFETTKQQYDQLVSRLNTAQLSQDAAQSGNNLKFRIISPPIVPLIPASPKRGAMLVLVLVLALGIGAGFAFFMHKIRPVFLSQRSLRDFSEFPVLGTLSLVPSGLRSDDRRHELVGFSACAGLLVVVVVVGLLFNNALATIVQHVFVMGAA